MINNNGDLKTKQLIYLFVWMAKMTKHTILKRKLYNKWHTNKNGKLIKRLENWIWIDNLP
jgi:hypothetical protein